MFKWLATRKQAIHNLLYSTWRSSYLGQNKMSVDLLATVYPHTDGRRNNSILIALAKRLNIQDKGL